MTLLPFRKLAASYQIFLSLLSITIAASCVENQKRKTGFVAVLDAAYPVKSAEYMP